MRQPSSPLFSFVHFQLTKLMTDDDVI